MIPPKIVLEKIEDYYTLIVIICGISEELFWKADYSFVMNVLDNKLAYDGYMNFIKYKNTPKPKK